ncbi:universal stress protein [Aromatoleum bremense]|uniref:Universal stress protein n=1 Tax=Aromatoleum bremense TaxID=76115 RepID=A0ABX1NRV0_9RHOO|nr:universal stress protein [Aromatoleum bremense]NMG14618.1 universal stress protein [Aromatoleum bremense]QTQ30537.1 Universal stress response protein A [Aromatoleum bremense]
MFKHILVSTDGSALSEAAIRQTAEFATATGARVTAFYAKPPYPDARFGESGFIAPVTLEKFQQFEDREAARILGRACALCEQVGVVCATLSTVSDMPAEAIIEAAERCGADLICMASHGRRGLRRLLIGSEAHSVLTHSRIPVLILKPQIDA